MSVWAYNKEQHKIKCLFLFDEDQTRIGESDLSLNNFPEYFSALRKEDVITAENAQTDSVTYELKNGYLVPRTIYSMMDTPFFLDGQLGGVLCCEHRSHRTWQEEDILFAQAFSDIITLAFKTEQRRNHDKILREYQKEIMEINQQLEHRISQRTKALETQNSQLAEYAYINSHLLRAPLCRILGLLNLIRYKEISVTERELILDHLKSEGKELDAIVSKINTALNLNDSFDRNFFKEDI